MRTSTSAKNGVSRELCPIDVPGSLCDTNRSKEVGSLHCFGRKPWSTGDGDGIIESNQEMISVNWGPGTH